MKYITANQFLEQPKEIQDILKSFIRYETGDRIAVQHEKIYELNILKEFEDESGKGYWCVTLNEEGLPWVIPEYEKWIIPLFTEGQLREFIEDKIGGKIDSAWYNSGYVISIWDNDLYKIEDFESLEFDLLQAYWQVACKIAKESVE